MSKVPLSDLESLINQLMFPFYQIERLTPLRFAPGRHENDAEHSWSLALFACAFASHIDPKLDVGKVCQFAVVHDLLEVYTGDIPNLVPEEVKTRKTSVEAEALKRLQSEFAKFPWVVETVTEYERQQTAEARFVKSVDKFLLLLFDWIDEGLCYKESKVSREAWQAFMQKHREKARSHPGVFEYYDEMWKLILENPQLFWQSKE